MLTKLPGTARVLGFLFLQAKYLHRIFLISIIWLSSFHFAARASDTIGLDITVLDIWTKKPLRAARVNCNNQIKSTNNQGRVLFKIQPADSVLVEISREKYYGKRITIAVLDSIQTIFLQQVETLPAIQVTGFGPAISPKELVGVNIIYDSVNINLGHSSQLVSEIKNSPGLYIKPYGATGTLQTISVRGLGDVHTVFTLDGIPLNNPQSGSVDLGVMLPVQVQQIEVYRGGNSSLFVSGAIGGAINFLPQLPHDSFSYGLSVQYGSRDNSMYNLTINLPFQRIYQKMYFGYARGENNYPFEINDVLYYRLNSDYKKVDFGYSVLLPDVALLYDVFYSDNERGRLKEVTDRVNTRDFSFGKSQSMFMRLKWHPAAENNIQIYWNRDDSDYRDKIQKINSLHRLNRLGMLVSDLRSLLPQLNLYSRIEFEHNHLNSTNTGIHQRNQLALAAILENQIDFTHNLGLKISGSAGYNYYTDQDQVFTPKGSVQIGYKNLSIYASIGNMIR